MRLFLLSLAALCSSCELLEPTRTTLFVDQCEEAEDGEARCLLITDDGSVINAPMSVLPPGTRESDTITAVIAGINP